MPLKHEKEDGGNEYWGYFPIALVCDCIDTVKLFYWNLNANAIQSWMFNDVHLHSTVEEIKL